MRWRAPAAWTPSGTVRHAHLPTNPASAPAEESSAAAPDVVNDHITRDMTRHLNAQGS